MSLRRIVNLVPIVLIRFYRAYLSPLLGPSCRYYPTCSQYALEAYDAHNFFYASCLTIWRILRCNPFSKGGYDPVPLQSGRKPDNLKEGDNG
ncbi:MAG: membrane protein insertion efficiency factor YidD [Chlorobium sp.]|uniref:membrane protein insertion efficiency factor YidD n=1 Tax=Chlorobium sp. TaxID=1095 RepID=UPI0025C05F4C|nr:membrane protein insertion efficiency factor YidD [Chlorobium sp.]MCF8382217.1 membrane protein insertion efficiency factor YidD [Chlorobium sp.]